MPISRSRSADFTVGITIGDPSGIGPELILKTVPRFSKKRRGKFLVIGSRFVLEYTAKKLGLSTDGIEILDVDNVPGKGFGFGKASAIYGRAAYEYIEKSSRLLKDGAIDGLVTCPINKEALDEAGYSFGGHTEILAGLCGTAEPVMLFVAVGAHCNVPLRVALVTRHIPLKEVHRRLSVEKIYAVIAAVHEFLGRYCGIARPAIAVCGLNPHAGESGALGSEERKFIAPAVIRAKRRGVNVCGPLPADAVFYDAYRNKYDCVISMYHDQGLTAFKMLYRDAGVNVTLGLPFVRTSPDHGTAFDIAGKGIANPSSLVEAIKLATRMVKRGSA